MKVLAYDADRCTGCHACEDACSEKWFKEPDRLKSAIQIVSAGDGYQAIVCTQCGDCIDVCPTKAISRTRSGVVVIQKMTCVGCLSCVGFCDIWAMRTHPDHVEPFKCVACGRCVEVCQYEDAITLVTTTVGGANVQGAVVTPANCVGCGVCVGACPNRAVSVKGWTLEQYDAMVDAIAADSTPAGVGA